MRVGRGRNRGAAGPCRSTTSMTASEVWPSQWRRRKGGVQRSRQTGLRRHRRARRCREHGTSRHGGLGRLGGGSGAAARRRRRLELETRPCSGALPGRRQQQHGRDGGCGDRGGRRSGRPAQSDPPRPCGWVRLRETAREIAFHPQTTHHADHFGQEHPWSSTSRSRSPRDSATSTRSITRPAGSGWTACCSPRRATRTTTASSRARWDKTVTHSTRSCSSRSRRSRAV